MAETRGNPLALIELPRGLTPGQLAGGFGLPGAVPLSGRIGESFGRQLDALPPETRRLLLLAAADPSGDPALVWRAAGRLGIRLPAAAPAAEAGLAEFGARVRFRHPLLRSVAYRSASAADRRAATWPWRRSPIRPSIPTAAPGTAPRPRTARTRTSRRSSSARRTGPRPAAAWPRRRRSSSARCC